MALKASLATKADLDALAEPLRGLYVEKDGKFVLDAEGLVPASELTDLKVKVGEFRTNNLALTGELEQLRPLKDKYKDVDVDEYQTLKTEQDKLKKKGMKGADDLEAMIASAVTAATKPLADKLVAEEQARIVAQKAADNARFRELFSADASKAGVRSTALEFVLPKAESAFELKDGAIVPKAGAKHPTDASKDLTPADFLQHLAKTSDYLFEPSTGGGANGGTGGAGRKPGATVLVNPTLEEKGRHLADIASGKVVVEYR